MGKTLSRGATALITLAGRALLPAVMGGVALITKTEPLVTQHAGVSERPGR